MTTTLATAFAKVAQLPPDDQEAFARWILEDLAAERRWADLFAMPPDALLTLATEALIEDAEGCTRS